MARNDRVAIVSGKGGTGKSLISASIGGWLAHLGFKVLLIDFDIYTFGLTLFLSVHQSPKSRAEFNLRDSFFNDMEPEKGKSIFAEIDINELLGIHKNKRVRDSKDTEGRKGGKLSLLKSIESKHALEAAQGDPELILDAEALAGKLKDILAKSDETFHYIIVDTRGGADATSLAAALFAKAYIIISEPDTPSFTVSHLLVKHFDKCVEQLKDKVLPAPQRLGFIINKSVYREIADSKMLELRTDVFDAKHLATVRLDRIILANYIVYGIPLSNLVFSEFSEPILNVVDELFHDDAWETDQKKLHINSLIDAEVRNRQLDRKSMWKLGVFGGITAFFIIGASLVHTIDLLYDWLYGLFGVEVPFWLTLLMIIGIMSMIAIVVFTRDYYQKHKDVINKITKQRESRNKIG